MLIKLRWRSCRLFPYERALALRELEALLGGSVLSNDLSEVVIDTDATEALGRIGRLTYFEDALLANGTSLATDQYRIEAAYRAAKSESGRSERQQTRYSAHGMHEYRGKFNPQIVRSLFNILGADENSRVADPFCGSGTVLVEAFHAGANALGVDLNPLAVEISNAKLDALRADPDALLSAADRVASEVMDRIPVDDFRSAWTDSVTRPLAEGYFTNPGTLVYLERWFSLSVLAQVAIVLRVADAQDSALRRICRVVASDILREVSYQEPSDLRIRRRSDAEPNYPVLPNFADRLKERVISVAAARRLIPLGARGDQRAVLADVRDLATRSDGHPDRLFRPDIVVTSPPYASALPYIDTQRLSLVALGLLDPAGLPSRERALIGGRELTGARRQQLESQVRMNGSGLPESAMSCVRSLLALSEHPSNGFRKRNVPALVYQYLTDMFAAFGNLASIATPNCRVGMVIGPNKTSMGEQATLIDTPRLLADIAGTSGWVVTDSIALDAYHRFDVHSANSIRQETLLLLARSPD